MADTKIPLVWTNDDITFGKANQLDRMLAFLAQYPVKASFAVIPIQLKNDQPQFLYDDPDLLKTIRSGRADGHEFFQHGTTHQCIENGIGDPRMYHPNLMGRVQAMDVSRRREFYDHYWSFDAIRAQIEWGRQVWIQAFSEPSKGYRPGCFCFCQNMYRALETLDFKWCSADPVSMTGWMWTAGQDDYPLEFESPVRPYRRYGEIVEIPVLDDIAFRPNPQTRDRFLDLGKQYWDMCCEKNVPYVLCSHWHGLEHQQNMGYDIHRELLDYIFSSDLAQPLTLTELYEQVQRGDYPMDEPAGAKLPDPPTWHVWHHQ